MKTMRGNNVRCFQNRFIRSVGKVENVILDLKSHTGRSTELLHADQIPSVNSSDSRSYSGCRSEERGRLQIRNSDTLTHTRVEVSENIEKFSFANIYQRRSDHSHDLRLSTQGFRGKHDQQRSATFSASSKHVLDDLIGLTPVKIRLQSLVDCLLDGIAPNFKRRWKLPHFREPSMYRLFKHLHRYLIGCGQHRNPPNELYVDAQNKLYSKRLATRKIQWMKWNRHLNRWKPGSR